MCVSTVFGLSQSVRQMPSFERPSAITTRMELGADGCSSPRLALDHERRVEPIQSVAETGEADRGEPGAAFSVVGNGDATCTAFMLEPYRRLRRRSVSTTLVRGASETTKYAASSIGAALACLRVPAVRDGYGAHAGGSSRQRFSLSRAQGSSCRSKGDARPVSTDEPDDAPDP